MPDESLKTYQEVMDYLRRKKRKTNLLFGNGFSIGFEPDIFSYNALSNFIKKMQRYQSLEIIQNCRLKQF